MAMLRPGSMSASDVGIADKEGVTDTARTIGAQGAKEGVAIAADIVDATLTGRKYFFFVTRK